MRKQIFAAGTLISMALGCDAVQPTAPKPSMGPTPSLQALSPANLEGVVGATADPTPVVQVKDGKTGQPLAGVVITFFPVGGGSVRNSSVVTGTDGIATVGEWTFGTVAGRNELAVWVDGVRRFSFIAMLKPDVPAVLFTIATLEQVAVAGDTLNLPAVVVQDRFHNPLPDVEVRFTVVDGGGSLTAEKTTSTQFGDATMPGWLLGPKPGTNTLSISVSGVQMLAFHALGVDRSTVKWFVLDSLAIGDGKAYSWPPLFYGISEARIGFISTDGCKCVSEQGYFIRTVKYTEGGTRLWSGPYKRVGNTLFTSYNAWDTATVDGDRIVLSAWDPWDEEYLLTWVYKSPEQR